MELEYRNAVASYTVDDGIYKFKIRNDFEGIANILFPAFIKLFENCPIGILTDFNALESELIRYVRSDRITRRCLDNFIRKHNRESLRDVVVFLVLKLFHVEVLFPILSDIMVNEIFIDGADQRIYIDHALLGRVDTEIKLNAKQLEKLLLFIKIYGDVLIAGINPSAKIDLRINDQGLRISIDMDRRGRKSIAIRKLSSLPPFFSFIYDRHTRKLLSLVISLLPLRPNIVIFGETGTGKTTLAGTLLSVIPHLWRIITIEDVLEIPDKLIKDKRIIRIPVPTFETRLVIPKNRSKTMGSKEVEIIKLLHRSPDFCFVSEIQDKSDTKAIFHAFAAGIKGIATTHAGDIYGLLNRWIGIYSIPPEWIYLIDILVSMVKKLYRNRIHRRIDSIYIPIHKGENTGVDEKALLKYTIKNHTINLIRVTSGISMREDIEKIIRVILQKRLDETSEVIREKEKALLNLFNSTYDILGEINMLVMSRRNLVNKFIEEKIFLMLRSIASNIESTINYISA